MLVALALVGATLALTSLDRGPTRAVTVGLAAVGALYGLAIMAPDFIQSFQSRDAKGTALKVLSTNVWSGNVDPDAAIAQIMARDPDVVLMQETNGRISSGFARLQTRYPHVTDCWWQRGSDLHQDADPRAGLRLGMAGRGRYWTWCGCRSRRRTVGRSP